MCKQYIITAYYTKDTLYEEQAARLKNSLDKFNVPYYITGIESKGSWQKNTSYKPTFILEMLEKFNPLSIVYVDCDAEFLKYPVLFDTLNCNIGVHLFDRTCYNKKIQKKFEVLSGTIFLSNNEKVKSLIKLWKAKCDKDNFTFDQHHLENILAGEFYNLPGEYCKIFDKWSGVILDPVIVHYQASRIVRKNKIYIAAKKRMGVVLESFPKGVSSKPSTDALSLLKQI